MALQSPLAQVLVARNAELAAAERRLEAARGEVAAARDQGARDLEAAERRHRAELSKEGEERKKLRQRELVLEVRPAVAAWGPFGALRVGGVVCWP